MNIWAERGSEKRGDFLPETFFLFYVLPFFGGGCGKVGDVHTSAPPSHLPEEQAQPTIPLGYALAISAERASKRAVNSSSLPPSFDFSLFPWRGETEQ